MRAGALLLILLFAAGCGGDGGASEIHSCHTPGEACTEYEGFSDTTQPSLEMVRQACVMTTGSSWRASACPGGALGGCQVSDRELAWFYPSPSRQTVEDVMQSCESIGAPYVPASPNR